MHATATVIVTNSESTVPSSQCVLKPSPLFCPLRDTIGNRTNLPGVSDNGASGTARSFIAVSRYYRIYVTPKPVRTSKNPKDMLRYDLENENETIRNYRDRIRQCETLGEFAMAEQIRQILMQEQDHQIDLATALGIKVPDVSGGPKGPTLRKRR